LHGDDDVPYAGAREPFGDEGIDERLHVRAAHIGELERSQLVVDARLQVVPVTAEGLRLVRRAAPREHVSALGAFKPCCRLLLEREPRRCRHLAAAYGADGVCTPRARRRAPWERA